MIKAAAVTSIQVWHCAKPDLIEQRHGEDPVTVGAGRILPGFSSRTKSKRSRFAWLWHHENS
jgi:hypothetical protein